MSFVNRRCTKGVPFLSKMVCKRIMGGGGGRLVDPLRITLCWVLPIITARSEKLCVLLLLFIVTFYAFCVFSYSIGMLPVSLHLSPLWALPLFDLYKFDISHVTHHMSALDQLKHSCTINRGGRSFPVRRWERICPISWRICKLLAVFIGLAIMGWLNLLTKFLIM